MVHSPWFHLGIDFVGPISPPSDSGNRYILTLSDYFTKWVEAIPLALKRCTGDCKCSLQGLYVDEITDTSQLFYYYMIIVYRYSCEWEFPRF